ncbi:MAG: hypothetical protein ACRBFS_11110 [Aureispira sp.]
MSKYIDRFKQMVEAIREEENIQIVSYYFHPEATEDEILEVTVDLDFFLEEDIVLFYKEMNGFQLRWIYKDNPDFDPAIHVEEEAPFDAFEPFEKWYLPYDGYINLFPINYITDSAEWETVIWSEEDREYQESFMNQDSSLYDVLKNMRPFDLFSRSICMSFFIEKEPEQLKVLMLGDELLDPKYSRITFFSPYIDLLLATKGQVEKREKFYYDIRGDLKPILTTAFKG